MTNKLKFNNRGRRSIYSAGGSTGRLQDMVLPIELEVVQRGPSRSPLAWAIPFLLALLASLFLATQAQALSVEPEGVRLYLPAGADPSTSVGVIWTTDNDTLASQIDYGPDTQLDLSTSGNSSHLMGSSWQGRLHRVELSGLNPDTTYHFRVGDGAGNTSSSLTFTTLPDPHEATTVSLGLFGSMGTGAGARSVAETLAEAGLDALVSPGGLALAPGDNHTAWDDWARLVSNFSAETLLLPGIGGADLSGSAQADDWILERLPHLAEGGWYEARLGGLQLLVLNGSADLSSGSSQYQWLEERLDDGWDDASVSWRLVSLHQPLYSSGTVHGSNATLQSHLEPLLARYPGTLLASAADSHYQRSRPLVNGSDATDATNGTVHLMVGHGGGGLGDLDEPLPAWSMVADNSSLGYLRLTLHPNGTLQGQALTTSAQTDDGFWFQLPGIELNDASAPSYVVGGEPVQLNGSTPQAGAQMRWVSDLQGPVLDEGTGMAWLANGTHRLSLQARWPDSSWSAPITFNITVNGRPRSRITTAPALVQEGAPADLSGQGSDDGELAGYEWRSDLDGLLSIEAAFSTPGLSNGTHNLSFWALDEHWEWSAPASVQLRVNGRPVVTRPTPEAGQVLRGRSLMVTFSGYDDATASENLTPSLAYRDPDGFLGTAHLWPISYNASSGVWLALFSPPYDAVPGSYTFLAHLADDEGGNSGWRPGPVLNVLNNRPATLFLGGDDRWLLPGQAVMVWAEGTDEEDQALELEPTLQFTLTGTTNWTSASGQNWTWNFSRRVHELWFTPPSDIMPAIYDLRVSHNDTDGGSSDWVALSEGVRVLEVHLGSPSVTVLRTTTASIWANLSHYDSREMEVEFSHRPLGGGPWSNASLSGQHYDGDLEVWRVNFTPPADAVLGPRQFAVTFHNASSNITSSPVFALLLEVLNNPPSVLSVGPADGPLATVQREASLTLWANGTDLEDPLPSLVPTFQYRRNGSQDNWSGAGMGIPYYGGLAQRWEAAYTPNATSMLGHYDLRARLADTDGTPSGWMELGSAFQVTNRPPVVLNLTVDQETILRNGTLTLSAQVNDEQPALLNATFEVQPEGEAGWISGWMDEPIFINGRCGLNMSPNASAQLGLYSARVEVSDPDGGVSNWFVVNGLFTLNNTPPHLQGYVVHNATPLRNSEVRVMVLAHDFETPAPSLSTRLEYRPFGTNATWVAASVTTRDVASGGYNVTWPLPAGVTLGNYSMRVQVTDGDGNSTPWWESQTPALEAHNNLPRVEEITLNLTQVFRGQEALLQIQTLDLDHLSDQMLVNVTQGPTDLDAFTGLWLSEPNWSPLGGGRWEATFTPPSNATLGNYTFQVQLTDPDNGTSTLFRLRSALKVLNNPPRVANFSLEADTILRGGSLFILLDGSDPESLPWDLTPQFGYLDGETIRPLLWPLNESGRGPSDDGLGGMGGRGEPAAYQREVLVPLTADLGAMELYARLVDDEGGLSGWWGPVNLSVRNNAPNLTGVNLTGIVTRTHEATLWVNGTDLETPVAVLGWTLRLNPENGSSASYYPLQEVVYHPANQTHRATFTVAATWPMGHYRVNLTLEDGEGGRAWPEVVVPFQVLNKPPEITRMSVEQELGDLVFTAEGADQDGEVVEYLWSLKNSSLLGRQSQFSLKAFNVGGGNRTFVVVAVDNDGGLSEPQEVTFKVDAPPIGANANKPWITARLIGIIMVAGLMTMVLGGATARAHNATLRELAQMPPYMVEEAFLVSWEGRPIAHASREDVVGGAGVDPVLAREILDSAREMAGARPGQLGYLGPWQLERGQTMMLITGQHHFLALVCQGRPPQPIWEAAEDLLRYFEGRTAFVDGEPVKISPEERTAITAELETLLDPTRALLPKQLKGRLALRQVELDTSLVARRGRLLWQVKVVNNGRFDMNRGVIHLTWDGRLAHGPATNRVDLPRIPNSSTETFLFPLEPRTQGEGECTGKLGYHIPGRWEIMELEPKTIQSNLTKLTIISDVARAHRLLEGTGGDRITIEYPLPELIKGEMVAQRARSALHQLGLRTLPELVLEADPTGPAIVEDSVWGGQDAHAEQVVAWLSLRHDTMAVELVAERPLTLVQGVAAFREQFKEKLGEVYELLEGS